VDVVYQGRGRMAAPWSRLDLWTDEASNAGCAAPDTTKAPDSRGLQSQRVAGSSSS
jgi:hypothetical protein